MVYLQSIQTGILLFFVFCILALIPYMIFQYRKRGRVAPWLFIVNFSFVLYLICAYAMTIFPLPDPAVVAKLTTPMQNLEPFLFIREFIKYNPLVLQNPHTWLLALKAPSFLQPAFNVLLTLPFGVYLCYLFKVRFRKALLLSFLLTLSFETIQRTALLGLYPRPYRLFDVDDLMLNTIGSLIGFGLAKLVVRYLPSLDEKRREVQEVSISYMRRAVAFLVDFIMLVLLSLWINFWAILLVIFALIPLIFGRTLGQALLKISIQPKHRLIILLRQFLSALNAIPLALILIFTNRSGTIPYTQLGENYLLILLSVGLLALPLLDVFIGGINRSRLLWYERLSKTQLKEQPRNKK
ncbi:MAG: VanZ family protein [Lactococcus hircilactis]